MTTYSSKIVLGRKYQDTRTQIVGYAHALWFNENGCVQVNLEFKKEGKIAFEAFDENRLKCIEEDAPAQPEVIDHVSDIELGKKYRDIQTGIEGHAAVMEFHEYMANRATLKLVTYNSEGLPKLTYMSIDDFLLQEVESGKTAKRQDSRPSPVTHEVERR